MTQLSQCVEPKPVSATPPLRWCGLSGVLETVIANESAINSVYAREKKENPLRERGAEMSEIYSLVKPVGDLITEFQNTTVPTGQAALLGLAALKLTTLNADERLDIITPERKADKNGTKRTGSEELRITSQPRQHEKLTEAGKLLREKMLKAIRWRWYDKRYSSSALSDHVFDMQMALHPTTANLAYVDRLALDDTLSAEIKEKITSQVVAFAVQLQRVAVAGGSGSGKSPAKRARNQKGRARDDSVSDGNVNTPTKNTGTEKDHAISAKFARIGLFTKVDTSSPAPQPSVASQVHAELDKLRAVNAGTLTASLSCSAILKWWKQWGRDFPLLARVARVVFAVPASAAVLERDFSDAGRMAMSSQKNNDTAYMEMVLFLHGNSDLIPSNIPELSGNGEDPNWAQNNIPERLLNPNAGVELLNCSPAEVVPAVVLGKPQAMGKISLVA